MSFSAERSTRTRYIAFEGNLEKLPRFLVLILSSNSQPSTGRPQRLSTELLSLSSPGNRFREQLQARLSQRQIMFQLPLHAQPDQTRVPHVRQMPELFRTIRAPIPFHIPISGEVIPSTLTADYTDFSD